MVTRRRFIVQAALSLAPLAAPSVVRHARLMRISPLPHVAHPHTGFVQRLYFDLSGRAVNDLLAAGRSLDEVAAELNRTGLSSMGGAPWTTSTVRQVVRAVTNLWPYDLRFAEVRNHGVPG